MIEYTTLDLTKGRSDDIANFKEADTGDALVWGPPNKKGDHDVYHLWTATTWEDIEILLQDPEVWLRYHLLGGGVSTEVPTIEMIHCIPDCEPDGDNTILPGEQADVQGRPTAGQSDAEGASMKGDHQQSKVERIDEDQDAPAFEISYGETSTTVMVTVLDAERLARRRPSLASQVDSDAAMDDLVLSLKDQARYDLGQEPNLVMQYPRGRPDKRVTHFECGKSYPPLLLKALLLNMSGFSRALTREETGLNGEVYEAVSKARTDRNGKPVLGPNGKHVNEWTYNKVSGRPVWSDRPVPICILPFSAVQLSKGFCGKNGCVSDLRQCIGLKCYKTPC